MRTPLPFAGGSKEHRSSAVASQRTINFYPEIVTDDQGKDAFRILIGTPGLDLFSDIAAAPCRGTHKSAKSSVMWEVIGDTFYEISFDGSFVARGILKSNSGPVYMDDNGTHVLIVDRSNTGYVYTIATGAWTADLRQTVIDSGDGTQEFKGGDHVVYTGGYFFVIQPGSNVIQACEAPYGTAPTTWGAADAYSTVLSDAGPLIALGVLNDELWAFGDYATTVFYNSANAANFPFSERPGAAINVGIAARSSLVMMDGSFTFLAKTKETDRFIVRTQGYNPTRISTADLEYAISKYPSVSDADAHGYLSEGHSFYQITFTAGNHTWVYDSASPRDWCERASLNLGRHRAFGLIQFNDKQIVGDRTTGKLYWQHLEAFTDNGDEIIRTRRFQRVKKNLDNVEIQGLVFDVETGVGLLGGGPDAPSVQGEDPQIAMRYSWNGGKNWSFDRTASVGKVGERNIDVRFPRLGTGNDWLIEFTVSDPVKWIVQGVYAEA